MLDLTEKGIKKDCPHCNPKSFALKHILKETNLFWVVCDVHPLVEGHILIIPKKHLSCVGEYDKKFLEEFDYLYSTFCTFVKDEYGSISSFEHGKIGQTVFHSHVHLLPYKGSVDKIVPEGKQYLNNIDNISALKDIFKEYSKYLFFSIGNRMWIVDFKIGRPRFFRDRFARALSAPERGNWKEMHQDKNIMSQAIVDIENLKNRWKKYNS